MRNLTYCFHPQKPLRTGSVRFSLALAVVATFGLTVWLGWQQSQVHGQDSGTEPPKTAAPVTASSTSEDAQTLLRQAHAQLMTHRSVQAELMEASTLTSPTLQMQGRYTAAGIKLKLEYEVRLAGGVSGKLTEVCDGERLWSLMELPGSTKLTRRDVRQILAAAQSAPATPASSAAVDLALGGLPAMLTSLQRSMQFSGVKQETVDGQPVYLLSGRWKPELAAQLGGDRNNPQYPPHIPDAVRLTLASDTLFPLRVTYLKRKEKGMRMLLDLRFEKIRLNEDVADAEFNFTPPEGIEADDITREYLDQLYPSAAKTPATGAAAK